MPTSSSNLLTQKCSNVKELSDLGASSLPSLFITRNSNTIISETIINKEMPTIDFSLLMSANNDERTRIIRDIGNACKEWGCFKIINHGMQENLRTAMMDAFDVFFDLTIEEKQEYMKRELFEPVTYGTSFNQAVPDVRYWRDYLRIIVHPIFSYPVKPPNFRKISEEYTSRMREVLIELLRAISESLGLPENSMEEALQLKSCSQLLIGNFYPPCPQPELALGLPPHSDSSILTILMQSNTIACLQVMHEGQWVPVEATPNSFFANVGDILEIASNGIYKSVIHRVMLNNKSTRLSVASTIGPPLDALVSPLPQLIDSAHNRPAVFRKTTYSEHLQLQQRNQLEKAVMNLLKL